MSNPDQIRVPSKTFLTGEYTVLKGGQALILTHAPFFKAVCSESSGDFFHPESPAGILEKSLNKKQKRWRFEDPHDGVGGFGGSTAEFLSVYKTCEEESSLEGAMKKYFEIFKEEKNAPSGADLCAQYSEEEGLTLYKKEPLSSRVLNWPFGGVSILIYKTNVKVKTHKHLDEIKDLDFSVLKIESLKLIGSLEEENLEKFIDAVEGFALEQDSLGLLTEETKLAVKSINQIEGVLSSRGCGAMGADVVAVFVKKERQDYVVKQIENTKLGLKLVHHKG